MDQVMRTSSDVEMADTEYRKWLLKRAQERKGAEDDLIRFLNVTGGSLQRCQLWADSLCSAGVKATVTAGPLLRATRPISSTPGKQTKLQALTHMPITEGTAARELKELIEAAHRLYTSKVAEEIIPPDPDTDRIAKPRWGSHSLRRGGTRRAQLTMHITGATKDTIDLHFRWRSKQLKKLMQNKYSGMQPRMWRLRVTELF